MTSRTSTSSKRALGLLVALALAPGLRAAPPCPLPPETTGRPWRQARSWVYQLQHLDLAALARSDADILVIDYSTTGGDEDALTPAELAALQETGKLVVAYLSIGEAEPYRFYWREGWEPGNPSWIRGPNPDWPDNFPVEYWNPAWKKLLFGSPGAYLDRILAAGFDGVYLDIVDGYEALEEEYPAARREMVDLVLEIAAYARRKAGDDFGVFPQNALGLLEEPRYRAAITGIGKEETYYFPGDEPNPHEDMLWEENELRKLVRDGKVVLTVDYPTSEKLREKVHARARARCFLPYLAGVELDRIWPQPGARPPKPPREKRRPEKRSP